jgi:hypothetical protein
VCVPSIKAPRTPEDSLINTGRVGGWKREGEMLHSRHGGAAGDRLLSGMSDKGVQPNESWQAGSITNVSWWQEQAQQRPYLSPLHLCIPSKKTLLT